MKKVKDTFPFLRVDPIVGQPTYDTIRALHKKLNANAASVNSHLGNGRRGLLYRMVIPAVYATLSDRGFQAAQNPGPTPNLPREGTQYQIAVAQKHFDEQVK